MIHRRDTQDDRAEHQEDQRQRRHQRGEHPPGETQVVFALIVHGRRDLGPQRSDDEDEHDIDGDQH
jgi:hypothetical protein